MSRHVAGHPLELEIKFLLPAGAQASLDGHAALQSVDGRERHEVTTYFDTAAGDLARKGASLRVRRCGRRNVQTLKLGSREVFGRHEWEWPVKAETPSTI